MASKDRILNLFRNIKDKNLQRIIADVVTLEMKNRTSSRDNFPKQKLRDIIDSTARLIESKKEKR